MKNITLTKNIEMDSKDIISILKHSYNKQELHDLIDEIDGNIIGSVDFTLEIIQGRIRSLLSHKDCKKSDIQYAIDEAMNEFQE